MFLNHSSMLGRAAVGGLAAGLVNGLLGGGGGAILVPYLLIVCKLEKREAFATSIAITLPLCLLSSGLYMLEGTVTLLAALPYLLGGILGGLCAGHWFETIPLHWLRRFLGCVLLYSGIRGLFS